MKYVKINVSNEASYSRINKAERVPTIFFNYKITASTIDITSIFNDSDVILINEFFINAGIVSYDEFVGYNHIIEIKAFDLISILNENNSDPVSQLLFEIIDPKTEQDNPLLFIITDFDVI